MPFVICYSDLLDKREGNNLQCLRVFFFFFVDFVFFFSFLLLGEGKINNSCTLTSNHGKVSWMSYHGKVKLRYIQ